MQTLIRTHLMALLLIIGSRQSLMIQPVESTRVNLFLPWFGRIHNVTCRSNNNVETICNLTTSTKAAEYNIINLAIPKLSEITRIERVGEWKLSDLIPDEFVLDHKKRLEAFKDTIESNGVNLMKRRLDLGWLMCQARVELTPGAYICIRDNEMYFCNSACTQVEYKRKYREKIGNLAPITGAFHYDYKANLGEFKLGLFDLSGRLATSKVRLNGGQLTSSDDWFVQLINPVLENDMVFHQPGSNYDIYRQSPLAVQQKLNILTRERLPGAYLGSITRCTGNPSSLDQNALCYSKANAIFSSKCTGIEVRWDEMTNPVPNQPPSAGRLFKSIGCQVYAIHEHVQDNKAYRHLVTVPLDSARAQYFFSVGEPGQAQGNLQDVEDIVTLPNDIIGLSSGNCHKTVAFFDSYYMIQNYNNSLMLAPESIKLLAGLDFFIMAAFARDKLIYFFSHTGQLIQVPVDLSADCKSIIFSDPKLKMNAFDFMKNLKFELYPNVIRDFFGLYELAPGANDTMPPTLVSWVPGKPDDDTVGSSFWIILLIMIVFTLFALIAIAALGYYFCYFKRSPFTARKASISRRGGFLTPYQTASSAISPPNKKLPASRQSLNRGKSSPMVKSKGIKSGRGRLPGSKQSSVMRKSAGRARSPIARKSSRPRR